MPRRHTSADEASQLEYPYNLVLLQVSGLNPVKAISFLLHAHTLLAPSAARRYEVMWAFLDNGEMPSTSG